MNQKRKTIIYSGDIYRDSRGEVKFVNDFDFRGVKRFYQIENTSTDIIRAFHGHKKEGKFVYVTLGSILFCAVYIVDFKKPCKKAVVQKYILTHKKPQVIYVPPHFANGFRALEENTKVIFYSTASLRDSKKDDYRIPYDYWGVNIWQKF